MPETNPEFQDLGEGHDLELPEEISRLHEPATPETLDRRQVQDHTDLLFQGLARRDRQIDPRILGSYTLFRCTRSRCHGETFRVLVGRQGLLVCAECMGQPWRIWASGEDNHLQLECADRECRARMPALEVTPAVLRENQKRAANHIRFVCFSTDCGAAWPVLEVNPPQMNDRIARNHGLYIPDRMGMVNPKNIRRN